MENVVGQRSRLTHYLIVKSIVELLFVGTLAVVFYLTAFTPYFRGSLDVADARSVAGWVVNLAEPDARVEVQLYIDGKFVAHRLADTLRVDVKASGRSADERHGFVFETPALSAGDHEARVYAVHVSDNGNRRTLQIVGTALLFSVTGSEKTSAAVAADRE